MVLDSPNKANEQVKFKKFEELYSQKPKEEKVSPARPISPLKKDVIKCYVCNRNFGSRTAQWHLRQCYNKIRGQILTEE